MHEDNSFVTLTYDDAHLKSPKLQYSDFQLFAKRLRSQIFSTFLKGYGEANWALLDQQERKAAYDPFKISIFVTGEYGDIKKRPHWHALIFNWRPQDCIYKYSNDRGDKVYSSQTLSELWTAGTSDIGSVTFESAGYVARYAAKKLVHGKDQDHDYQPISKKSSHQAIGKKFLEKFWPDIFNAGNIILPGGQKLAIPRYYLKWLEKNHPEEFLRYTMGIKNDRSIKAEQKALKEKEKIDAINEKRRDQKGYRATHQITKEKTREELVKKRFARLQQHLKGDL